ncbi:MFS general substrate transporter [Dacryopinax primogenitus]|uniref:MFS general substrate transporter n=1 Tax=Dacryopinax primogenitus (strain DJM 731) TaxID=1858805 RepID=M5FWS7_DACPD|nr:MFS general substrate transporter [Dacryopinax primogenitus]EJU00859.1 MFS general substrate transporter [Dacryopinax primogenitus]
MVASKDDGQKRDAAVQLEHSQKDKAHLVDLAWTSKRERRLVRKIDAHLLPMLFLIYIFNYLDRTNIGNARIAGMADDLQLDGSRYNWALSIFFFGYLILQGPSNLILAYTKPSIYLPIIMICWATISACTAAVQSYQGLLVVRFFLGVVEAGVFPGAIFLLSSWYTRKELAKRVCLLYTGSIVSGAFGGLFAYGITNNLVDARGITAWRWLFLIEGVATIAVALLAIVILPDFPLSTRWLSTEERQIADLRLARDGHERGKKRQISLRGLKLALRDWRTYLFILPCMTATCAGTFTYFIPTLVADLGYTSAIAQAMSSPPYVWAGIVVMTNGTVCDWNQQRAWHSAVPITIAGIGFILLTKVTNDAVKYFALFLCGAGVWAPIPIILSWLSDTMRFPPEKRAFAIGFVNTLSNLSSVYGSQLYPSSDGPQYWQGHAANAAFCFSGG